MAQFSILNKLTTKDMLSDLDKTAYPKVGLVAGKTEAHALFTVFGRVLGFEAKTTDKGDFIGYKGMFEGHRSCDSAVKKSSNMILPKLAEEALFNMYVSALPKIETGDKKGQPDFAKALPFPFGFTIGVEPSAVAATGYRFTVSPVDIGDDESNDPLADLKAKIAAQLPSPVSAPALTDKTKEKQTV